MVRYKSEGRVEIGIFLLDVYCLGVKNAAFNQCQEDELPEMFDRLFQGVSPNEYSGEWGRKLVEGAAAYARSLGFAPHRDYKKGARVMGGIDPKKCSETFVYGINGKPTLIAGPNDDNARCDLIMKVLFKKFGTHEFDYLHPITPELEENLTIGMAE